MDKGYRIVFGKKSAMERKIAYTLQKYLVCMSSKNNVLVTNDEVDLQSFGQKKALEFALKQSSFQKENNLYYNYLWKLKYILARWKGVISLFTSYKCKYASSPREAKVHFLKALSSLEKVEELYRDRKEYHMALLKQVAKDVEYNPYFLKTWYDYNKNSFWEPLIGRFHVVWERFDEYRKFLTELNPTKE